jgi:hypothetical protein
MEPGITWYEGLDILPGAAMGGDVRGWTRR